jgi:upstream activation factor subunit UAF30
LQRAPTHAQVRGLCASPKRASSDTIALIQRNFQEEESMAKAAGKAKANSGFMKPMQPSEHLAKIVGAQPLPRSEVTKKIWAHIKKNKLQNPKNKREILADEKLQPIFGEKKLDMFQMTKAVNKHLK